MRQYILKRLLMLVPVLFLISIMVFSLMRIIPGDAALLMLASGEETISDPSTLAALRAELGLDKSYPEQYLDWIGGILLRGDMGTSFWTQEPVLGQILKHLPVTVELAIGTTIISLLIAIPVGVISATRQDSPLDYIARILSIGGLSMPGFWLGTLLIVFPAIWFGYLAPLGYTEPWKDPWANLQQFIFPSLAMGAAFSASTMRMTRSTMLEVLRQDFVRTALAKGLRERVVIYRHALKNAMIPVITITGIQFGYLLGRTVIMETVFALPGLGTLTLRAILQRDYPQIQGNVLFIACAFVVVNLIVDLLYAWLDPRIRYA